MSRTVHDTGIPVEGMELAFEYEFPLSAVPSELDAAWRGLIEALVGRSADEIHDLIRSRLSQVSAALAPLVTAVLTFRPFSLLIYDGTPLFWLEKRAGEHREQIYLPPEGSARDVESALSSFGLTAQSLLKEFIIKFGGLGDRRPWEAVEFAGMPKSGKVVLRPATDDLGGADKYIKKSEVAERRRRFEPWRGGLNLLTGGDDLNWHIGADGTLCEHEMGSPKVRKTFASLEVFLEVFLSSAEGDWLFRGAYYGL